jgi:anthranilate synthase component 1
MSTVVIRTLPSDHLTPVRAYAALRAQSPGRSSFLFESAAPGGPWGRRAILGYRARSEGIYPGGFDAFATLRKELSDLAEVPEGEAPSLAPALPAGLARALVGFIAYDAMHRSLGVEPWPNEGYVARLMRDPTAVVFNHAAQTMTIAGASDVAVRRCAWEMAHGPELQPLPAPDPEALPENLEASPSDETYAAKVEEARRRVAAGEARGLVLARTFEAPLRGADPFDAYRALRLLAPCAHLFFIEFGASPFSPGLTLVGASPETLVSRDAGPLPEGAPDPVDGLREAFEAAARAGSPTAQAAQIIRALEIGPRLVFGGAVGYLLPGYGMELAAGRRTLAVQRGYFEVMAGAEIEEGSTAETALAASLREARPVLAAIRAAHAAQEAREAAARRKAEAEKAAAEKAAAEQAGEGSPEGGGPQGGGSGA